MPCDFGPGEESGLDSSRYDELPSYTGSSTLAPEVIKTIDSEVDKLSNDLRALSLKIHDQPELGFQEKFAHDTLTQFMEERGWTVKRHYKDLSTAWRAEFSHGRGGRTLGFNSEMDALPGIGHACGHNLIAIAGVGGALSAAAALRAHNVAGKVVLLGTPAEEGGGGKIMLLERGAYAGLDACLMAHPGPGASSSIGTGASLAIRSFSAEFVGHTAHAGAQPWEGQNALDAAVLAYTAVSALRQQIKPTHRVHGIIEGRDWAPNIIPDYAKLRWYVRAPTTAEVDVLYERVVKCFEGAALAAACKLTIKPNQAYADLRQNTMLADEFAHAGRTHFGLRPTDAPGAIGGSTDFGNVTYALPGLHPSFAITTEPEGGNHTAAFTKAARTHAAHSATLQVAKALAAAGVRVLTDDGFYKEVKKTFEKDRACAAR